MSASETVFTYLVFGPAAFVALVLAQALAGAALMALFWVVFILPIRLARWALKPLTRRKQR